MASVAETSPVVPLFQAAAIAADVGDGDGASVWAFAWSVACEFGWFGAGYVVILVLIRTGLLQKLFPGLFRGASPKGAAQRRLAMKNLQAAASAGELDAVREAWGREKARGPLPLDALKDVLPALLAEAPGAAVAELAGHLEQYPGAHRQPATLNALAEAFVHAERPDLARAFVAELQHRLGLQGDERTRELLLEGGGVAAAAAVGRGKARELDGQASARGCLTAIKSSLNAKDADAALLKILAMQKRGLEVPPSAITLLFKVAKENGSETTQRVLSSLEGNVSLPVESFALLLNECLKQGDIKFARRLDALTQEQKTKMHYSIYEPLLKLFAKACDARATAIFADMQAQGSFASEGLCGCLLARCSESQNLRFAEAITEYCRSRSLMTLSLFKTLMKVYACCGKYELACDLYEQVLAAGLQPDNVMIGCLVKFAVKCGRRELAEQLLEQSAGADIQNYMWLIRAAGKDGNVGRALELLREAEKAQVAGPDVALYNCVLDVYVTNGRMDDALAFFGAMKDRGTVNLVTYNTVMKGHCAKGDVDCARGVLAEMKQAGVAPDSASYNCLLGAAALGVGTVRGGDAACWEILDEMSEKGTPIDNYTVSIMMKVAKKAHSPQDAERALAVLDRAGRARVFDDEVLFNSVIDACIQRRDTQRLAKVLASFTEQSTMKPSVQTYGLLIKANSMVRQVNKCWELWTEMVEARSLLPNAITLSCMLDALICARRVDDALALFRAWQGRMPPNIVMYGTLIKGFAAARDADRAMEMYHEIRAQGLQLNLLAYTSLIDAHARGGEMARASKLFQEMIDNACDPNVITFSTMVKGYCVEGDLENAFSMFSTMLSRGIIADTVLFNTLLDGCVRHSRFQLADHLLSEMEKYSVEPSHFTLSIVIKLWGKRRDLEKAFEACHVHARSGRSCFDVQVVTSLISACFLNRAVDRAVSVLDEMPAWRGCPRPDATVFGALLGGLVRGGALPQALDVAQRAIDASAASGVHGETWASLAAALAQQGMHQELAHLTQKLASAGVALPCGSSQQDGGTPAQLHGGHRAHQNIDRRRAPARTSVRD